MLHELKIKQCYLCRIIEGSKSFEVRLNDRDYQVEDIIKFLPLEDKNYDAYSIKGSIPLYRIVYIMSNFEGLKDGYVAMAIREMPGELNLKKGC
jgi:hypothetical protein